jgi:hypothetical protein
MPVMAMPPEAMAAETVTSPDLQRAGIVVNAPAVQANKVVDDVVATALETTVAALERVRDNVVARFEAVPAPVGRRHIGHNRCGEPHSEGEHDTQWIHGCLLATRAVASGTQVSDWMTSERPRNSPKF